MDTVPERPTLRSLLRRSDLRLRLEVDEADLDDDALDRPVRWVHSSDLADPTPFLSEGLALLTTGTQFRQSGEDDETFREYVARLADRGVCGLGFGTEVVRDGIPPGLASACREHRMPLFEVPYRTPFIAVARANAEAIAVENYARRTWALAAQRAISLAALRPDGLGATLAELARQLDAWVGLYDAAGTLTREHPHGALGEPVAGRLGEEVATVLRRGARAASSLRLDDTPFTLQTLGRGGRLRGVIAIATGDLDQEGRSVVTAVIAMAGLALEQNQGLSRARGLLRSGLLQSLHSGDPALARRIAREQWGGLPSAPIVVAAATDTAARSDAAAEWLELRATETRGSVFFGRDDDRLVLVVPASDRHTVPGFAAQFEVRVGVSRPVSYADFADAHAQALTALRRGTAQVTHVADLVTSGMLSALDAEAARALASARLAPLRAHDAAHGTDLEATLRAWLEHDARGDAAASALGIHRHTVRARVEQAARLLGEARSSVAARADLWMALRAAPPAGADG